MLCASCRAHFYAGYNGISTRQCALHRAARTHHHIFNTHLVQRSARPRANREIIALASASSFFRGHGGRINFIRELLQFNSPDRKMLIANKILRLLHTYAYIARKKKDFR